MSATAPVLREEGRGGRIRQQQECAILHAAEQVFARAGFQGATMAEIALRADVKETLKVLVPLLKKLGGAALADRAKASLAEIAPRNWSAQRAQRKARLAAPAATDKPLPAEWVMMRMSEKLPKDAIVVEEGLTSTTTLPSYFPFRDRNSFFGNVSGGIGWGSMPESVVRDALLADYVGSGARASPAALRGHLPRSAPAPGAARCRRAST